MHSKNEIIGLITARGGSKGVPRKNVLPLAGKPLIAWTIETALQSDALSRVILSTDDSEIAKVGRHWEAEVPFMRPIELSQDNSPSMGAVLHAVNWLAEHEDYRPEYVMLLQPTSPLLIPEDIQKAIQIFQDKQADSVVSVTAIHQHPYWTKTISPDGRLVDFFSTERSFTKRQDLPAAYALNGAIYLARRDVLLERSSFYGKNTLAYVMPPERSLDIDTPWEFHLAELILKDNL
jgi:CMP-N,N'-diacetyllegionaminic acid synthase